MRVRRLSRVSTPAPTSTRMKDIPASAPKMIALADAIAPAPGIVSRLIEGEAMIVLPR